MEAGFTFVLAEDVVDKHLWIVLSDTARFPDQVVIVSFTTYTPQKDQACIVEKDEHPSWLRHRSCISYTHAKIATLKQLRTLRNNGGLLAPRAAQRRPSYKIRERAGDSTTMISHIADILEEQGIIRLDAWYISWMLSYDRRQRESADTRASLEVRLQSALSETWIPWDRWGGGDSGYRPGVAEEAGQKYRYPARFRTKPL